MIFRFAYEFIVGVITIVAVIMFGEGGGVALALLAPLPIILRMMKYKPDERELALFYKSGNLTILLLVASMFTLGYLGQQQFFSDNWMFITACAMLISHGVAGLIIFTTN